MVEKRVIDQSNFEHAVMDLISSQDFAGYLLTRFDTKIVETLPTKTQTACLMYVNGRFFIRIAEKFFNDLTPKERIAILKHEVAHFVNKHFARRNGRDPDVFNLATDCLLPTAQIQTARGLIEIQDIQKGDSVHQSTGDFGKVVNIIRRPYQGLLHTIKGMGTLPFQVTNEHPLLIASRKKVSNIVLNGPVWKKANEVMVGQDYLLLPQVSATFSKTHLDLSPYFDEDPRTLNHTAKGIRSKQIELTQELAWVLGLYVAEGSRISNKDFGLAFSLHKDETNLQKRASTYFENFGYKARTEDCVGKGVSVRIGSTILGKAFSNWCGRGAINKKVPEFILHNTNVSIIENFLLGYFAGDGHQPKPYQKVADTISKQLALQLQQLIGRLGLFATIQITPAQDRILNSQTIHGKQQYRITWATPQITPRTMNGRTIECNSCRWKKIDNYFAVPIVSLSTEEYNGDVCNIETENNTFLINNIVSHNCAINQGIENLPANGIILPAGWEANEASEYYYEKYLKMAKKQSKTGKCGKCGKQKGQGKGQKGKGQSGGSKNQPGQQGQGPCSCGGSGNALPDLFDEIIDAPMSTGPEADSMAGEIIRETIKDRLNAGVGIEKLRGLYAGGLEGYIDDLTAPPITDWRHVLSRFAATLADAQTRMTLKRPDRRGLSPFGRKKEYLPALVVCVDTSGSVSDEMLSQFFSQIALLGMQLAEIEVVIADAKVHEHFTYYKGLESRLRKAAHGRGGTDFDPAVQYINTNLTHCDGVVYLTDGWCPVPQTECRLPLIWIVTEAENFEGKPKVMCNPNKGKRR